MEKVAFPWLDAHEALETSPETPPAPTRTQKIIKILRPALPFLGFGAILLVLFVTRTSHSSSTNSESSRFEVLVPLVPIPKGAEVYPETLKQIPIDRRDFSKQQLLQVARSEDISKLRGRLRAKKNIPLIMFSFGQISILGLKLIHM